MIDHKQLLEEAKQRTLNKVEDWYKRYKEDIFDTRHQEDFPLFVEFLKRILEWYMNPDKQYWLYNLTLHIAGTINDVNYLENIRSFAVNTFLDDSSYDVKWMRYKTEKKTTKIGDIEFEHNDIIFRPNGTIVEEECNREDKGAYPVLVYANDDGEWNPKYALEAMDFTEKKEIERLKSYAKNDTHTSLEAQETLKRLGHTEE